MFGYLPLKLSTYKPTFGTLYHYKVFWMKIFKTLAAFSLISLGAPQAFAQDNLTCVSLADATAASLTIGFIAYWPVVSSNGEKGCARKDAVIVEKNSCRFKSTTSSKPQFQSPECLYNGVWVDGLDILKQQTESKVKSAAPVNQDATPSLNKFNQSNSSAVSKLPQASNVPSVIAKDYWTVDNPTFVYDETSTTIDTLTFGVAVTTYGEKNGLGKIDLIEEKWVKLSNLSITKPPAHIVKSPNVVSSNSVTSKIEKNETKDEIYEEHFVSVNSLNYRDAPNGVKLGSFPFATRLLAYERHGSWVRISKAGDSQKWVSEKYLSDTKPSSRPISTSPSNQSRRRLTNSECGTLRLRKLSVKTQSQFDAIERQLSRGGCNSQQEARKKQWDWVQ